MRCVVGFNVDLICTGSVSISTVFPHMYKRHIHNNSAVNTSNALG